MNMPASPQRIWAIVNAGRLPLAAE